MRAHIVLTDEQGRVYEGEVTLTSPSGNRPPAARKTAAARPPHLSRPELDFGLHARAFMKRFGSGLGGPQRFTLLLAHMAKGKAGVAISAEDLRKQWSKMKGPMGGDFYTMFGTRAKDAGWVDTAKKGQYALRANWADALGKK